MTGNSKYFCKIQQSLEGQAMLGVQGAYREELSVIFTYPRLSGLVIRPVYEASPRTKYDSSHDIQGQYYWICLAFGENFMQDLCVNTIELRTKMSALKKSHEIFFH